MNLIKRFGTLEKLYGTFKKYSTLSSSSVFIQKRNVRIENLLITRIRYFLEKIGEKNGYNENSKINAQAAEMASPINWNLLLNSSRRYNELVALIEAYTHKEKSGKKKKNLRTIDDKFCKLLGVLSASKILHVLHLLMRTGINITTLKLYKSSLLALQKILERDCLSKEEKLQFIFFQALAKKLMKKQIKSSLNSLPPFQDLSLMEKIVVAHTTFKCSIKLKRQDARSLEEHLENNANELVEDLPILVTICKALSYSGTSNEVSLNNLDRAILESPKKINTMDAAHLLSFYVQANHQNSLIVQRVFCDSMPQIIEDRNKIIFVRIKDFDRLVWALSMLNHRLDEIHKEELVLFVCRRYKEFTESPYLLINTLLALWILNCRLYKIIDKCLSDGVFEAVKKEARYWKRVARLHLLLVCIKIESPERNLPIELFEIPKVVMKVLKPVKKLWRLINKLDNKLEISEITIDCPVEAIYITGVSFKRKQISFHLDLLNETTCFKGSNVPHGLMNLKLRLLEKIGYLSILIPEDKCMDADFVLSEIMKRIEKNTVVETC